MAASLRKQRILQVLSHITSIIMVTIAFVLVFLLVNPFERGFYCTDESIRYPYKPDTVPIWAAGAYSIVSAIIIVIYTEVFLLAPCCFMSRRKGSMDAFLLTTARGIFLYTLGAISTLLITEVGKHTIGRLRPHFITVCQPDWEKIQCFTRQNDGALPNYISLADAHCSGDPKLIKEARLSFPSGHTSFTTYSMIFIIIYLEARLVLKRTHYLKPILQLIAFIAAWYTGMSRVSDFKHHHTDVIGGAVIGISVALFIMIVTGRRLWNPERDQERCGENGLNKCDENLENGVEFEERPHTFNL